MNRFDQVMRLIAGTGLMYVGFYETSIVDDPVYNLMVGLFGVLNVGVSLLRVCPVYFLIGFSSLARKDN